MGAVVNVKREVPTIRKVSLITINAAIITPSLYIHINPQWKSRTLPSSISIFKAAVNINRTKIGFNPLKIKNEFKYYFNIKIRGKNFADRFLPYFPLFLMMIPILLNHLIASWATYMRCHKQEPMMLQSVVIGVCCCISTISLGHYSGVIGIIAGYLLLTFLSFIWTYFIFINKKKEWHNEK